MVENEIIYFTGEQRYLFDGERFTPHQSKIPSSYAVATALCGSLVTSHTFKVPSTVSEEKLAIQAEITMYEEAGLDAETDYTIDYVSHPLDYEASLLIESFAVENSALTERFAPLLKQTRHIDYLIPSFLGYQGLYLFEKLEARNDLFIYISENDAYAAIYKEGTYISLRSLPTLAEIAETVGTEVEELRLNLARKGLENANWAEGDFLKMHTIQEQFAKIVEKIVHAVNHKRGVFALEGIDRFFIDFEGNDIEGFLPMFDAYGFEASEKQILSPFADIDPSLQHDAIVATSVLAAVQHRFRPVNLSVFKRQPNFLRTRIGELALSLAAGAVLTVGFFGYSVYEQNRLETAHATLQNRLDSAQRALAQQTALLKKERAERDRVKAIEAEANNRIETIGLTVDKLHAFKRAQHTRQQMMRDINDALRRFGLTCERIEQKGALMQVHLVSANERRDTIARFMKLLLEQGYSSASTEAIERDETMRYKSIIEIVR